MTTNNILFIVLALSIVVAGATTIAVLHIRHRPTAAPALALGPNTGMGAIDLDTISFICQGEEMFRKEGDGEWRYVWEASDE